MTFRTEGSPMLTEYLRLMSPQAPLLPEPIRAIGEGDALIVIDMQNDFIPYHPSLNPFGGNFGVAEGQAVVEPIAWLVREAVVAGARVIATRDYHPGDHCSFMSEGGPFPAHCIQGSKGAEIIDSIADALAAGRNAAAGKVQVAFKAFHEDVDSFGGLPYMKGAVYTEGGVGRLSQRSPGKEYPHCPMGCTATPWTGCMILKQSALVRPTQESSVCSEDINSPPDILAMETDRTRGRVRLQDELHGVNRLFVCGLALDYCVSDTCINAKALNFPNVYMVLDAARAAHIPGVGGFGSGFLQDPAGVLANMRTAGVNFACMSGVVGKPPPRKVASVAPDADEFPKKLTSMGLISAGTGIKVSINRGLGTYTIKDNMHMLKAFSNMGIVLSGKCSQEGQLPDGWPGALPGSKFLRWAYPLDGLAARIRSADTKAQIAFLSISASPALLLATYGGFLVLDERGTVMSVQALSQDSHLMFGGVQTAPVDVVEPLRAAGRLQKVTLPSLMGKGASEFCWLVPNEELQPSGWKVPAPYGAFLYTVTGGTEPIYFPLHNPNVMQDVGMPMSADLSEYVRDTLSPVLQSLMQHCVQDMPRNAWPYVLQQLEAQGTRR